MIENGKPICDRCGKEIPKKCGLDDYVTRTTDTNIFCWDCYRLNCLDDVAKAICEADVPGSSAFPRVEI